MQLTPGTFYADGNLQTAATEAGNGTPFACIDRTMGAFTNLVMQVEGISGDTITFEATVDGTNWLAVQVTDLTAGTAATTATADCLVRLVCLGLRQVRARISTYNAGTITVAYIATA